MSICLFKIKKKIFSQIPTLLLQKKAPYIHIKKLDNFKILLHFLKDHHAATLKWGRMILFSPWISDLIGYQRWMILTYGNFPAWYSDMDTSFGCQSRIVPLLLMGFVWLGIAIWRNNSKRIMALINDTVTTILNHCRSWGQSSIGNARWPDGVGGGCWADFGFVEMLWLLYLNTSLCVWPMLLESIRMLEGVSYSFCNVHSERTIYWQCIHTWFINWIISGNIEASKFI